MSALALQHVPGCSHGRVNGDCERRVGSLPTTGANADEHARWPEYGDADVVAVSTSSCLPRPSYPQTPAGIGVVIAVE